MQHLLIRDKKDDYTMGWILIRSQPRVILIAAAADSLIHVWLYGWMGIKNWMPRKISIE